MDVETKPLWTTEREAMGKRYSIGLWPDDVALGKEGSTYAARMVHRSQTMAVNAVVPFDGRDEGLLHEIIHRVAAEVLDDGLEEKVVGPLSAGLFAFLRGFGLWRDFPWPDREERPYLPGTEDLAQEASSSTVRPEQHAYYGGRPWGGQA